MIPSTSAFLAVFRSLEHEKPTDNPESYRNLRSRIPNILSNTNQIGRYVSYPTKGAHATILPCSNAGLGE